jgi:lipoate-protein ligase A
MAIDRAILEMHAAGGSVATLRLYTWDRPTVSLGRFQSVTGVDTDAVRRYGVGGCRRPTGGRGVLHDDELTYSVTAGVADGLPRGVAASYRVLCSALVEAYRQLGVEAALTAGRSGDASSPACYLQSTAADLSHGAAKLSGSAQVWSGTSCLQHGSFIISRDTEREADIFALSEDGRHRLTTSTMTIAEVLGHTPDRESLTRAVCEGFERSLGISLEPGCMTDAELNRAAEIEADFTVDPTSWT